MPFQFRKEAIEEDLNTNFPSQGQGNPPLYYSLSEVVVPTYSINNVAEGTSLPENLQTAWDFSTGHSSVVNTTTTFINNTGFWLVDVVASLKPSSTISLTGSINITDGLTSKPIWEMTVSDSGDRAVSSIAEQQFVVFVRSGDSVNAVSPANDVKLEISYRQIADVNGNLVNPLGFSFA